MFSPEREAGGRCCVVRSRPPLMTVPGPCGRGRERARAEWFVTAFFFFLVPKAVDAGRGGVCCRGGSLRANSFHRNP